VSASWAVTRRGHRSAADHPQPLRRRGAEAPAGCPASPRASSSAPSRSASPGAGRTPRACAPPPPGGDDGYVLQGHEVLDHPRLLRRPLRGDGPHGRGGAREACQRVPGPRATPRASRSGARSARWACAPAPRWRSCSRGVQVGQDQRIGPPRASASRIAMTALDSGRITIAATSVGIGQAALDAAARYATAAPAVQHAHHRLPGRRVHARGHGDVSMETSRLLVQQSGLAQGQRPAVL
jgi:hypothetical protein